MKKIEMYKRSKQLVSYACGVDRIRMGRDPEDARNIGSYYRKRDFSKRHESVSSKLVYQRINILGWSEDDAMTIPVCKSRRRPK